MWLSMHSQLSGDPLVGHGDTTVGSAHIRKTNAYQIFSSQLVLSEIVLWFIASTLY